MQFIKAAANNKESFYMYRSFTTTALSIALVVICGWVLYAKATEGGQTYGPLPCSGCNLETPMPGPGTQTFLDAWTWDVRHTIAVWTQIVVVPGDKIIVCNGSSCVTYTMTNSNSYLGGPPTPQTSSPGGGAGGGIGGGGGSEGDGGGGGFGGDTCSVVPGTSTGCSSVNGVSLCQTIDTGYVDCGFGH
ncbi:hypothetical protein [Stenotrophomonas indicatrix]|jgi:uncharacterized membrane protein YgcG|uniref:hypothetical protein n=2 Tax=Stenotrophomonas indicatrix TaxID=2045451 RepID=UPI001877B3F7|nr:hypothetical protein [Stenotrophomonas indicatrix]MDN8643457.1 hypothetical protein [Stenotrophomonas indicatrix]MDN8655004.1 hypothetical protein [Stenotrophomonas indicatrix]